MINPVECKRLELVNYNYKTDQMIFVHKVAYKRKLNTINCIDRL